MHTQRTRKGLPAHLPLARKLRRDLTPAEAKLWYLLRARNVAGIKFRRQHRVGPYILDFFCPERRLAVEVDGDWHAESSQVQRDSDRTRYLVRLGIRLVRYANGDVLGDPDRGGLDILKRMEEIDLPPPTPPYKGGE